MNTIRRYAADDAHVIYGTAYDESLGDQLRVTVIATGLSSARRAETRTPPLTWCSSRRSSCAPAPTTCPS
jgi:cell division protein FtsZ